MAACVPFYQPGQDPTGRATGAAVVGGRFVMQAATKADGENLKVKYPTGTTVPIIGVTAGDAADGEVVDIFGPGYIVPVEVGSGGVTYGTFGMVDTAGKVVAHSSTNVKACLILTTTAADGFAMVRILPGS